MKKIIFFLACLLPFITQAQKNISDSADKAWFPEAKFGVFIHWMLDGISYDSLCADYKKFSPLVAASAQKFTAANFNPGFWAEQFKSWGAKYVVITTKHHIGFSLYDCDGKDFSAAKASPAKRDLLKEYADAMRAAGLKVGFYFSLPDAMNPDYCSIVMNEKSVDWQNSDFGRWQKFTNQMLAEIRHLCINYGTVDLFWFDGDWERTAELWRSFDIADTIRKYQPHAVINNRLRHIELGDYTTPEMVLPVNKPVWNSGWFELCTTLGYNWNGPDAFKNLKNPAELVRIFGDMISIGGNVLLNISPDYTGKISDEQIEKMSELGKWITSHSEAIYGAKPGLPHGLFNGASTHKGSTIYLIAYETAPELVVKNLEGEIESITHLKTGTPLKWRNMADYHSENNTKGWRFITLPDNLREEFATVIKIKFKDKKVTIKAPTGESIIWMD